MPLVLLFFHWETPSGKEVKLIVLFCEKLCCSGKRTVNATILELGGSMGRWGKCTPSTSLFTPDQEC
jgi:hypothetical protein